MKYQAVMFDLDGTLADTLLDISISANHALAAMGQPTHPTQAYRYLAGQGVESLMRDALGPDQQHLVEKGVTLFRSYYKDHSLDNTGPFEGMAAVLNTLVDRGVPMAVLSNKPHPATVQVVRDVFGKWPFAAVQGHQPPTPLKPDPTSALQVARSIGIAPEHWLYVGDTRVDMETAVRAGFYAVGVLWGFRDEAELRESGARTIISHPSELLGLL